MNDPLLLLLHVSFFLNPDHSKSILGMDPPLAVRLTNATKKREEIADRSIAAGDELGQLNRRFSRNQNQPVSDGGRSLGHRDFFNHKRKPQEIMYDIGVMIRNYHTVR